MTESFKQQLQELIDQAAEKSVDRNMLELRDADAEIEQLKSKLKVAVEALNDIFNKAKDGSHCEQLAREALKEIES